MKNCAARSFVAVTGSAAAAVSDKSSISAARAFAFAAAGWLLLGASSVHAAPLPPAPAGVEVTQEFGQEFVTVSSPGNAPYQGGPMTGALAGRGGVSYEYRMRRLEITTAEWLEFVNTFQPLAQQGINYLIPNSWGAWFTFQGWQINPFTPDAELVPVSGITWREAAMYCNWLHNDKRADLAAIADGAYDTSTFTNNPDGSFNDQETRSPGARFWIPSLDEWLKAVHYDPDRFGSGIEGWWESVNRSDEPPAPGFPGAGQSSGGLDPQQGVSDIPLGAYPDQMSPWGLFDTSGGASELNEEVYSEFRRRSRGTDGAHAGTGKYFASLVDQTEFTTSGGFPDFTAGFDGLRLAAAVPGPSSCVVVVLGLMLATRNKRA